MIYLLIDTCSNHLIISIIKNMEMIYYFHEPNDTTLSSRIMPILAQAFDKTNLTIQQVDKLFIVSGPGSFTGIRVGVTIAKVIGSNLEIPLIPLNELELMATTKIDTTYSIPFIDARRGYVYTAIYDQNLNVITEPKHMLFSEIVLPESYTLLDDQKVEFDLLKIIRKHEQDSPVLPHTLMPNYLKRTEAEEKLND